MASSKLKFEKLPPTERAAYLHCLRVYLQIQEWTTLEDNDQEVVNLGWTLDGNVLVLQMTSYRMQFVLTVIWHHRIHEGVLVTRALTTDSYVYQRAVTVVCLSVKTSKNPILHVIQFHRMKLQMMMILIIFSNQYLRRETVYVLIILN